MSSRSTSAALKAPGAAPLIAASVVARLPLAMFSIGLLVHAQHVTGSFAVAGVVGGVYVAARSLAVPPLGRIADRYGQTKALVVSAFATAVLVVVMASLPRGSSPVLLVLVAAGIGFARPPVSAAVRALLPRVVEAELLPSAYALESIAFELTFIFGPPLALFLAALWSTGAALACSGVVMLVATIAFALQPASRDWQPDRAAVRPRGGALRSPALRLLVLVLVAVGIVFGAVEVGVTVAAKSLGSTADAAPVLALWGVGSLVGGVVAARLGDAARRVDALLVLLVGLAAGHGALAATTRCVPAMAAVIFVAGATIAPLYTSVYAMAERTAPAGTVTEAFAWLEAAVCTGTALGSAGAGIVAQRAGSPSVFGLAALAGLAGVAAAAFGAHALVTTSRRAGVACDGSLSGAPA